MAGVVAVSIQQLDQIRLPIADASAWLESLQFLYGEDIQGDEFADIYRASAADVTDFNRVVSIRIGLLIKSETDFLTDSPVAVNFLGDNFNTGAGADRRLRLQFFTTVGLRNRVP